MEAVGEDGVDAHRPVEVLLGAADVAEVVFGYPAEEIVPVVGGVEAGQDVEILDGEGVLSVLQGGAAPDVEDVAVVLGPCAEAQAQEK